ncbi:MAG: class I SAM-dependent methyltransferase [Pseudomonadales bacterium]
MLQHANSTCPVCAGTGIYDFSSRDLMFDGVTSYDYHRCTGCDLVYQQPLPTQQQIASFYPESYSVYSKPTRTLFSGQELLTLKDSLGYTHLDTPKKHGILQRLLAKKAVPDVISCVPDGKVLDIGCGNGEYLLRLKSIGWQCQGVEFNDTALAICREHGLEVFHGDLKAANFAAESFDFVTAHHLIEHTADPGELIREMARITKPGGTILIRTPNSKALGRRWFGVNWFANDVPRHLMLFCAKSLAILTEQHDLQLLKLSKPVKPKLVLKSLDYKLGNTGVPSKKRKARKWLAKLYVPAAKLMGQGDELFALYRKP